MVDSSALQQLQEMAAASAAASGARSSGGSVGTSTGGNSTSHSGVVAQNERQQRHQQQQQKKHRYDKGASRPTITMHAARGAGEDGGTKNAANMALSSSSGTVAAASSSRKHTVVPVSTGSASQLRVLHQRTQLRVSYFPFSESAHHSDKAGAVDFVDGSGSCFANGRPKERRRVGGGCIGGWKYEGVTTLYCIDTASPTKRGRRREIGLHLRKLGGMKLTSVRVYVAAPKLQQGSGCKWRGVKRRLDEDKENREGGGEVGRAESSSSAGESSVERMPGRRNYYELQPLTTYHLHLDPLEKILWRTVTAKGSRDGGVKFHADAQSSRGGHGMALSLRAAAAASTLGELRVVVDFDPRMLLQMQRAAKMGKTNNNHQTGGGGDAVDERNALKQCWREELASPWSWGKIGRGSAHSNNEDADDSEDVQKDRSNGVAHRWSRRHWKLRARLNRQTQSRRAQRMDLLSSELAEASSDPTCKSGGLPSLPGAMKIVIKFRIDDENGHHDCCPVLRPHSAGLVIVDPNKFTDISTLSAAFGTPHLYTTTGTFGDCQGPRAWLPCLDSPSALHRSSHELTVEVISRAAEGLTVMGCGEEYVADTELSLDVDEEGSLGNASDRLIASHMWCSVMWGPAPIRSLGFAVAPFRVIVDPECLSRTCNRSDDGADGNVARDDNVGGNCEGGLDGSEGGARNSSDSGAVAFGRKRNGAIGTGGIIRQAYFAPRHERHLTHNPQSSGMMTMNRTMESWSIPDAAIMDSGDEGDNPCNDNQDETTPSTDPLTRAMEITVTKSTSGVPLRAAYLTQQILALPAFRTGQYVQIWIPHAVDGGDAAGTLGQCLATNAFVGGAIMDAALLPPPRTRLPFHPEGRCLQLLQARNVVTGWVIAAVPLGRHNPIPGGGAGGAASAAAVGMEDDEEKDESAAGAEGVDVDEVGEGYIHTIFVSTLMGFYERAYGGSGEGGSVFSHYYTPRYAAGAGMNSNCMDVVLGMSNNVEDEEDVVSVTASVGLMPHEEKGNDELWRSANNGTESRTSALDEYSIRQVMQSETLEAVERVGPLPSMGWLGSQLSLSFLASNTTNATGLGCGLLELLHPVGGVVYRAVKSASLSRVSAGRAGMANMIRVMRACFLASLLADAGEEKVNLPSEEEEEGKDAEEDEGSQNGSEGDKKLYTRQQDGGGDGAAGSASAVSGQRVEKHQQKPRFVACIDELIKKGGITHVVFTRSLRVLAGPTREPYLNGSLVDVGKDVLDSKGDPIILPEGFPNSYVRGCTTLYLRVGAHVEVAGQDANPQASQGMVAVKGIHLHVYAEPAVPEGGCVYAGPIVMRVIENESQCREFVRTLNSDGSRCEWGPIFLHARPVTNAKQQTAASGTIDSGSGGGGSGGGGSGKSSGGAGDKADGSSKGDGGDAGGAVTPTAEAGLVFTEDIVHVGGYQALELVRLTNRTPLLWIRVDPHGLYDGRIAMCQPDACLGEQLFHDSDAAGQVEAIRALAERPLRIQGSVNISSVYDVDVGELPVRLLGDCLRGSAALHSSLPHTPAIRVQAALAIAQWQNNKAPPSKDSVGSDSWIGLNLLLQYFNERYTGETTNSGGDVAVIPVKFTRIVVQKPGASGGLEHQYLDETDTEERPALLDEAESIEVEEDEEYRVRCAVMTAIACIRAKDGLTPALVLKFLEAVIPSCDGAAMTDNSSGTDLMEVRRVWMKKRHEKASSFTTSASGIGGVGVARGSGDTQGDVGVGVRIGVGVGSSGNGNGVDDDDDFDPFADIDTPYVDSTLVADALLALCHVHARIPPLETLDEIVVGAPIPAAGEVLDGATPSGSTPGAAVRTVVEQPPHPIQALLGSCRRWLDWSLYKEMTMHEVEAETRTGMGLASYAKVAPCAITALCLLSLMKQSTSRSCHETNESEAVEGATTTVMGGAAGKVNSTEGRGSTKTEAGTGKDERNEKEIMAEGGGEGAGVVDEGSTAQFYANIFDTRPARPDATRAAAAQAILCVCCAADRLKSAYEETLGLLTALEMLLNRIIDPDKCSPRLRQTLASLMMDACTGKVCSMQRVASIVGRGNDFVLTANRFLCGPLGASFGGDNGSALLMSVSDDTFPAANAVNDGARLGLGLLKRSGLDGSNTEETVVRVAKFATKLWRTINGESAVVTTMPSGETRTVVREGVCAHDGHLRASLLAFWQWVFPKKGCIAVIRVQSWRAFEETQHYKDWGATGVMKNTEDEKEAAMEEEASLTNLQNAVTREMDRQQFRCEMAKKTYDCKKNESTTPKDPTAAAQGLGHPLPLIKRDNSWRLGGWVTSTAQQRREKALDGGTAVTKLRLKVAGDD